MSTFISNKNQGSCPAKNCNISKQNCLRLVTDVPRQETQMVMTHEGKVVEQSPSLTPWPYRIYQSTSVNRATSQHHCVPSPSRGLHHDRLHTSHPEHRCPSNSDNAGLACSESRERNQAHVFELASMASFLTYIPNLFWKIGMIFILIWFYCLMTRDKKIGSYWVQSLVPWPGHLLQFQNRRASLHRTGETMRNHERLLSGPTHRTDRTDRTHRTAKEPGPLPANSKPRE